MFHGRAWQKSAAIIRCIRIDSCRANVLTPRFHVAEPLPRTAGAELTLRGPVAQHMQVLRLAAGDALALFDGLGGECAATLVHLGKREAAVRIEAHYAIERESPLAITLVQALTTGDKMDTIVQKAVELGAVAIQPISTSRATVRLNVERAAHRREHWQAVATAACEQCGRNRVPEIHPVLPFERWLAQPSAGLRALMHPEGGNFIQSLRLDAPIELVIGPEGGFAPEEIDAARRAGFAILAAGPRVLRTETAGMALLAALNAHAGGFGA
ncbi:MAG: 16S rRNA (uracil(1498)-N(3))-methyltransferase [Betaproteobacteria bacterium]|nr:16S rRNA (uracil(1498)-N(3))-methyltransferase [Betaproteobacteria bacterium]